MTGAESELSGAGKPEHDEEVKVESRERLSRAFFEIEEITLGMDKFLQGAEDHPAEISQDEATMVKAFLKEMETILAESFELFVSISDA